MGAVVCREVVALVVGVDVVVGVGAVACAEVVALVVGVGATLVVAVGAGVVGGAVVVVGPVVVGAVVFGAVVFGVVVLGALVGEAVVVRVGVGVGVGFTPPLWTLKRPCRVDVMPSVHVRTTLMVWVPSASFAVLYGRAMPSVAVPAKSKGAFLSVRTGGIFLHCGLSM